MSSPQNKSSIVAPLEDCVASMWDLGLDLSLFCQLWVYEMKRWS